MITNAVEHFKQTVAWSATLTRSNSEIHIKYSSAIKEKIAEKRKLRKLWQINRYLEIRVLKDNLNRAIKTLKNLLYMDRNQGIKEYLS